MKDGKKAGWEITGFLTGAFFASACLTTGYLLLSETGPFIPGASFNAHTQSAATSQTKGQAMSSHLYPESTPYNQGYLPVDGTHSLHYQEFGNPAGIPVVYLHGGPGGGTPGFAHQFFDPAAFRIITFDQRGAGKSIPFGETKDNSPDILVEDMEKLRAHLGIDTWHVAGGSWGSTLSLLYAEEHPDRVDSLMLRGIFLGRKKELDFLYKEGDGDRIFPEQFAKLRDFIPEEERGDLLQAYYKRIAAGDKEAARVWSIFEGSISRLVPPTPEELQGDDDVHLIGMALMETHFFVNHGFEPEDRILQNIDRIRHIPTIIAQGRYDAVCPPTSAWDLHQAFPESHLEMVLAGHSAKEDEIQRVLVESANRVRDFGSPLPRPGAGNGGPATAPQAPMP